MQISQRRNFSSNMSFFKILILAQLFMLVAISLQTRTPLIWIWAISSFIPPIVICIVTDKKRYVIPSLLLSHFFDAPISFNKNNKASTYWMSCFISRNYCCRDSISSYQFLHAFGNYIDYRVKLYDFLSKQPTR